MSRPHAIDPKFGEELQMFPPNDTPGDGPRGEAFAYRHVPFAPLLAYALREKYSGAVGEHFTPGAHHTSTAGAQGHGDESGITSSPDGNKLVKRSGLGQEVGTISDGEVAKILGRSRRSIIRYRMKGTLSRLAVERICSHIKRHPTELYKDWY